MARIFISYSRRDEAFARQLAASLSDMGSDIWIDVEDIPAGMKWSSAIQQGLDSAEALVVIISPDSMVSRNVEDEWQYFLDHNKPVIPVLLREAKIHFQLNRIQWVDFLNQPYDFALIQLHGEFKRNGIHLALPPVSQPGSRQPSANTEPEAPAPAQAPGFERPLVIGAVVGISILAVVLVMGIGLMSGGFGSDGQDTPDEIPSVVAELATEDIVTDEPTEVAPTLVPTEVDTEIPTSTPTPTEQPLNLGPMGDNSDWTPIQRTINGVAMVLVPMGSVQRGATQTHFNANLAACSRTGINTCRSELSDESSNETIQIRQPFWIDRTESASGNFPEVNLDWTRAQAMCAAREAELPTESQWEWAAKGPSNWRFTWGNEWDFSNPRANICDASNCSQTWALANYNDGYAETAPVESFADGASWVGAINMIGNVWEWTADFKTTTNTLRGGGWTWHLGEATTTTRDDGISRSSTFYGYRCVRDYVEGDLERYSE